MSRNDAGILEGLRAGNEDTFVELVTVHSGALAELALTLVPSREMAEAVVRETWRAVLERLDEFDGRTSLRVWVFRLASDIARSRCRREGRFHELSTLSAQDGTLGPSVDQDRFLPPDDSRYPGHWAREPMSWATAARLSPTDTYQVILTAMSRLPRAQRIVITLRDVQGWSVAEVCEALTMTERIQRALLQHGRAMVRTALEEALCA